MSKPASPGAGVYLPANPTNASPLASVAPPQAGSWLRGESAMAAAGANASAATASAAAANFPLSLVMEALTRREARTGGERSAPAQRPRARAHADQPGRDAADDGVGRHGLGDG